MAQAFKKYLQTGGKYCPKKETFSPELALKLLKECRAFPALAHPLQYKFGTEELNGLVAHLKELGLAGLEVYHSSCLLYTSRAIVITILWIKSVVLAARNPPIVVYPTITMALIIIAGP